MANIAGEVKNRIVSGPLKKVKGTKHEHGMSEGKMKREMPTFNISAEDLPEVKDWEIGKSYKVGMVVEMVQVSKGDYMGMGEDVSARLKVKEIASNPGYLHNSKTKRLMRKFKR